MYLLYWALFGLVVGAVAKLVTPGRDPGGCLLTMVLGIVGAYLGGALGRFLGFYGPSESAGFVFAIVGAVIVLLLYRLVARPAT